MRGLFALAAATDTAMALLGRSRARRVTKTALMPVLAAEQRPGATGPLLGLAGSWAGDIALLRDDDRAFLVGLGSFLGAHVAYAGSFAARGGRPKLLHVLPVAACTAVTMRTFGRMAGPLRRPVQAYAVTIGTMAATATALRGPGSGRVVVGAATFVASDTLLALARFALAEKWHRAADAGVMATYTLGQWLIHDGLRRYDAAQR
ncbi:lysoplasmalogenase [Saccharopolyspora erythraea]|uniref:lysoplasmalogenase n=1 Tax=Saccharopolyspora erythraea TaxID=1836 RepID=UPI001BAB99C6|nr:lysoplasmalogenase [Saccharopolyspora erythraea]QUH00436.1 lysoplasmalogenase [Saccharopolyspora erythraea]